MKRKAPIVLVSAVAGLVSYGATVTPMKISQMWPWNAKTVIEYRIDGDSNGGVGWDVVLKVTDPEGNDVTGAYAAQSGDLEYVKAGTHRLTWNPVAAGVASAAPRIGLTFSLSLAQPVGRRYLVMDLSAGVGGTYAAEQMDAPPDGGFNTDMYKTTKMAFRRCRAGSYFMGSQASETKRTAAYANNISALPETRHLVTFTNDFYLALFELTYAQSFKVWETNVTTQAAGDYYVKQSWRPTFLSPDSGKFFLYSLRGCTTDYWNNTCTDVDPESFFGRFRSSAANCLPAGYTLDLPTEAQWEYACRAGTDGSWNAGAGEGDYYGVYANSDKMVYKEGFYANTVMDLLGNYCSRNGVWDQGNQPGAGGGYLPNAWGFYDMHGNAGEVCRDVVDWTTCRNDLGDKPVVEPLNVVATDGNGFHALVRGGDWLSSADRCRSAARAAFYLKQDQGGYNSFRPAIVPERKASQR